MQHLFQEDKAPVLINPALPRERISCIQELLWKHPFATPHLWIASSGSFAKEGTSKWVALSREALSLSAAAVNQHLQASANDIWLNPLPLFHVGGLGIEIRALLTNSKVVQFRPSEERWSPAQYYQTLCETKATLTSLVPTQLYDLVVMGFTSPRYLRAVVIGGGALEESLYRRARALGWRILPSYGMTEAASQVATASLSSLEQEGYPRLQILPHLSIAVDEDNLLTLSGKSLFSLYGMVEGDSVRFVDPKVAGSFITKDRGVIDRDGLKILGRADDIVKIVGENVDISALQRLIDQLKLSKGVHGDCYVVPKSDSRRGSKLVLVLSQELPEEDIDNLLKEYNLSVFPYERIEEKLILPSLPKTSLGKLERNKLPLS
ncbi:AMP-binding protein [Estrella lausannensis]|uniref:Putative o-succinylbenzoate-CoA ligase n=1 Tax=Estrella lausannensis TaxID=483423 RepID=A0A0H5DNY2_9BACT|nr:AMP-binding protein [Estrella lausannensis]CRX38141.1 Putative o-succinylbenzoate-CoA ligase [Estrella lausannensis]